MKVFPNIVEKYLQTIKSKEMNFVSREIYKSLTPFRWDNIANLSIITGLNGAGKTQLLNLISGTYYNALSTSVKDSEFEDFDIRSNGISVWNSEHNYLADGAFNYDGLELLVNLIYDHCFLNRNMNSGGPSIDEYINKYMERNSIDNYEIRNMCGRFSHVVLNRKQNIVEYILQKSDKNIREVKMDDIAYYLPIYIFLQDRDLARNDGTEFIFYMFLYKRIINNRRGVPVSENEPTPWGILNEVIETSNLPYKIIEPEREDIEKLFQSTFHRERTKLYKIKLIDNNTGVEISMNDLSSGEKTLMSLALTLFYTQEISNHKNLLILDEPDAHLHPSMTKQFYKVIYEVLVKKYGTKVIMTTHSPSSVSLAPEVEDCKIYELKKNPTSIIECASKVDAINFLTEGLILVTSHTKYILVEGVDDKPFYEAIFRKFISMNKLNKNISLAFVPGIGKDSVGNWSKGLRNAGLGELVKGVIDRDNNNEISEGIYRLNRYSIENYMLDPIYIFCVANKFPVNFPKFGYEIGEESKINLLNNSQIQTIVDMILAIVKVDLPPKLLPLTAEDEETNQVSYTNGFSVNYPRWFLEKRGKDLFGIFYRIFGDFNKRSIIHTMKRIDFLPNDILELFVELQS